VVLRELGGELTLLLDRTRASFSLGSGVPGQVDLMVPRQYVSRLHAIVERDAHWLVVTNRSQNGTYFGGRREERSPVKAGQAFMVGKTELLALDDHLVKLRGALLWFLGFDAQRAVDLALMEIASELQPPLVLTGPRGSEPELLASEIHRASPRRDLPFEILPAGAPSAALEAVIARADGGTLFVDLRPLRDRKAGALAAALFDRAAGCRAIIAAPTLESARGTLGGRGGHLTAIQTPPIAERKPDVRALLDALLGEHGRHRVAELPPLRQVDVCEFDWPDNHEDLRRNALRLHAYLDAGRNQRAAARALGVDVTSLGAALARIGAIARRGSSEGSDVE